MDLHYMRHFLYSRPIVSISCFPLPSDLLKLPHQIWRRTRVRRLVCDDWERYYDGRHYFAGRDTGNLRAYGHRRLLSHPEVLSELDHFI